MPRNRNENDPLEARRKALAEQQRQLAEQMSQLTEQLHRPGESAPASTKPAEPPIWRMEEDAPSHRALETTPAPRRDLARQRQRDMVLFFALLTLALVVLVLVLWVAYVHDTSSSTGA